MEIAPPPGLPPFRLGLTVGGAGDWLRSAARGWLPPPRANVHERAGYFGLRESPPPVPQDAPFNGQNVDVPGGRDGGGAPHPERPCRQRAETDGQPPGGESAPCCPGKNRLSAQTRLRTLQKGKEPAPAQRVAQRRERSERPLQPGLGAGYVAKNFFSHQSTKRFCSSVSGYDPASLTAISAAIRSTSMTSNKQMAKVPVRPIPAPQCTKIVLP